MKKIQTLNEQLNRMKGLMDFKLGQNSHDTLSDKLMNEQKVDPKDLENVKPSDTIGIGTDPEKKENPTSRISSTMKTGSDVFKGVIQDIYKDLGACKGIIKQIESFALGLTNPNIDKTKFTYQDFMDTMKGTKKKLDIEIQKGDTEKNSPLVQKIINFSKNNLDSKCVEKFQTLLLKYTNSEDKMETPDGKKKYTDGIVGLLTLNGFVDSVIDYYSNIFKQYKPILTQNYFQKELTGVNPQTKNNLSKNLKRRADASNVKQKTKTVQSLKGKDK